MSQPENNNTPAENAPPAPAAKPAARRPGDVRWRAITLTIVLVVFGGLMLEFSDKLPEFTQRMRASAHVDYRKRNEVEQRFQQGVAMLHARQYDNAVVAFGRVLELAPKMPEAHVNMGFALLELKDFEGAKYSFHAATELRSNQINAYFGLAEALQALGDTFGAMQAMETYIHLSPQDDPFRRKAEAAVWELRTKLNEEKARAAAQAGNPPAAVAKSGEKP